MSSASTGAHTHRRRRTGARRALLTLLSLLVLAVAAGALVVLRDVRDPSPAADAAGSTAASTTAPPSPAATTPAPPPPPAPPSFDRAQLSISDPASIWVVVDKARPLNPLDYAPTDLVPVGGGRELRAEAAQALGDMFAAAAAEGLTLTLESAYRSYDYQVGVFDAQVARFGETRA